MSFININSWEQPDGELKDMICNMNRMEEEDMVRSAKKFLQTGQITKEIVRTRMNEFMNMYPPNTRKFYLIPEYLKTLD